MTKVLARTVTALTVAVVLALALAGPASADRPENWGTPYDVDFMHTLLVLVGIPLAVIVALALLMYVPPIVRGESVSPAGARADDEWFGGRRDAEKAIEAPTPGAGAPEETGGASGSW